MAEETKDKNIRAVVTFKDDIASRNNTEKTSPLVTPQEKLVSFEAQEETPSSRASLASLAHEVAATSTVQESVLADKSSSFDSTGTTGTIIRETKRNRFRLLPAMIEASQQWLQEQKQSYDTSHHPYHAIAKADARKEVIEAAVAKSAVAPREDFKTVAERLKEADRKPVTTTMTLRAKEEVPPPTWASFSEANEKEEAAQTLTPPVVVSNEEIEVVEESSSPQARFTARENTHTSPETIAPTAVRTPPEIVEPVTPPQEIMVTPNASVPQEIEALQPVTHVVDENIEPPKRESDVSQTDVQQMKRPRMRFNPQYLIGFFLVFAVISGVAASFLIFKPDTVPQKKAVVYTIPSGINAPQEGFTLAGTREDVLLDIATRLQTNSGVIHLYATFPLQDGSRMPATAEQIFSVLTLRTGASFNRNVSEVTFGGLGQEPFLLMKTQSFDTAFAGMLAWEKTMSADLSPLFGAPVVMSFDPSARTDTQVRDAFFKDTVASNKNVRLLLDEEGKDRIVYTFVDQNTLLITTTRTSLDALLPLLR